MPSSWDWSECTPFGTTTRTKLKAAVDPPQSSFHDVGFWKNVEWWMIDPKYWFWSITTCWVRRKNAATLSVWISMRIGRRYCVVWRTGRAVLNHRWTVQWANRDLRSSLQPADSRNDFVKNVAAKHRALVDHQVRDFFGTVPNLFPTMPDEWISWERNERFVLWFHDAAGRWPWIDLRSRSKQGSEARRHHSFWDIKLVASLITPWKP